MGDASIDLFEAIYTQRAIRSYKPDTVPEELLVKIVEAGTKAPSGGNVQPWAFVVVRERSTLDELGAIARDGFAGMYERALSLMQPGDPLPMPRAKRMIESYETIPVVIVACLERQGPKGKGVNEGSVFPAVQNMLLAARGLGLGAALTGGFVGTRMADVKALLGLPENVDPIAFVPIGYPDRERYGPTTRRPVEEVLHWDRWEPGKANTARPAHRLG